MKTNLKTKEQLHRSTIKLECGVPLKGVKSCYCNVKMPDQKVRKLRARIVNARKGVIQWDGLGDVYTGPGVYSFYSTINWKDGSVSEGKGKRVTIPKPIE